MIDAQITGDVEIAARWNKLINEFPREAHDTMQAAMLFVHGEVPAYPAPLAPGVWASMTTPKQKAAFFAQMAEGGWHGRRVSAGIGGSITTDVRSIGSDVVGVIGSNKTYAPWVISSERTAAGIGPQAAFHLNRWWTLQAVVKKALPAVVQLVSKRLAAWMGASNG